MNNPQQRSNGKQVVVIRDEFGDWPSTPQQKSKWRGSYGERRLAKKVKGVVVGRSKAVVVNGTTIEVNPTAPPDVVTEIFSFESKWLKNAPVNITKVMEQSRRNCPEGLVPVGVIGDRTGHKVYYILEERDFLDLHC